MPYNSADIDPEESSLRTNTLVSVGLSILLVVAASVAGLFWSQSQAASRNAQGALGQAVVQAQDDLDEAVRVIRDGWLVNGDARWLGIAARDLQAAGRSVAVMKHLDERHRQDWVRVGSALLEASYQLGQMAAGLEQGTSPTPSQQELVEGVLTLVTGVRPAFPDGVRAGGDPFGLLEAQQVRAAGDAGDRFQAAYPAVSR